MGDEQLLLPDLINAARWAADPPGSRGPIKPVNNNWETRHDVDAIPRGGSGNIPKMREAIRYLRDPQKYDSEATWLRILTQERDELGFMAFEAFSSIYEDWHLYSHLTVFREAVFRAQQELVQLSTEWLQLYFMGNAFAYVRGHRLTVPGMRSVGHMANASLREYSIELALTEPGQPVALPQPPDDIAKYLLKSDERQLIDLYRPEIQRVAAPVRAAFPDPDKLAACYVAGWTLQVPFHFSRARDGIAAWAERNCNANTAPVLAGVQFASDNKALWLPPGGGTRYRKWDDARCQRQGDVLAYTSPVFGANQQAIPCQGIVEYVWRGKSFARADGSGAAVPPPGPVEPPDQPTPDVQTPDLAGVGPTQPAVVTPPADQPAVSGKPTTPSTPTPSTSTAPSPAELNTIADGIAALLLAKSQHGLQKRIVQELRTTPLDRPPADIAADVATFGIGPGQEQAKAWKSLIARLRALGGG